MVPARAFWRWASSVRRHRLERLGGGAAQTEPETPREQVDRSGGSATAVDKVAQTSSTRPWTRSTGTTRLADWNEAACADVAQQFQAAASSQKSGKLSEATFDAGLCVPSAATTRRTRRRSSRRRSRTTRSSTSRAPSWPSISTRPTRTKTTPSARSSRPSSTRTSRTFRRSSTSPCSRWCATRTPAEATARTTWSARRRTSSARSPSTTRYMPAFNQLALYYFQQAKKRAGQAKSTRHGRHL